MATTDLNPSPIISVTNECGTFSTTLTKFNHTAHDLGRYSDADLRARFAQTPFARYLDGNGDGVDVTDRDTITLMVTCLGITL